MDGEQGEHILGIKSKVNQKKFNFLCTPLNFPYDEK